MLPCAPRTLFPPGVKIGLTREEHEVLYAIVKAKKTRAAICAEIQTNQKVEKIIKNGCEANRISFRSSEQVRRSGAARPCSRSARAAAHGTCCYLHRPAMLAAAVRSLAHFAYPSCRQWLTHSRSFHSWEAPRCAPKTQLAEAVESQCPEEVEAPHFFVLFRLSGNPGAQANEKKKGSSSQGAPQPLNPKKRQQQESEMDQQLDGAKNAAENEEANEARKVDEAKEAAKAKKAAEAKEAAKAKNAAEKKAAAEVKQKEIEAKTAVSEVPASPMETGEPASPGAAESPRESQQAEDKKKKKRKRKRKKKKPAGGQ